MLYLYVRERDQAALLAQSETLILKKSLTLRALEPP